MTGTDELSHQRRGQVLDLGKRLTLDHMLLGSADNIRYATEYRSLIIHETADHMLCLLEQSGEAQIFGPHVRDIERVPDPRLPHIRSVNPVAGWTPLHAAASTAVHKVGHALREAGARNVGYDTMHPLILDGLKQTLPEIRFHCVSNELFDIRRVKLPGEIALMERAATANLAALEAGFEAARPGMSDREILAVAVSHQQRGDAELITHFTCNVESGYDWFAGGRRLEAGQAIFMDQVYYGAGGYASDLTRTAFVGDLPSAVLDAYRRLVEVNQELCALARPGVSCSSLDEMLNGMLAKAGLAPAPYSAGHGIGLRVMEPPTLFATETDWSLQLGEVIALEPESSVEFNGREYPIKVEDCYLVEESGLRPLTTPAGSEPFVITA